jgi:hypothetical protein
VPPWSPTSTSIYFSLAPLVAKWAVSHFYIWKYSH